MFRTPATFLALPADRRLFLFRLTRAMEAHGCALHAAVVLDDSVHLVMSTAALGDIRACAVATVESQHRDRPNAGRLIWQEMEVPPGQLAELVTYVHDRAPVGHRWSTEPIYAGQPDRSAIPPALCTLLEKKPGRPITIAPVDFKRSGS
jgi:hypothetical protein